MNVPKMKPAQRRKMHYILAVVWLFTFPLILVLGLTASIPLLVFISVYANVAGHWSAGEAAAEDDE
jgi:uncharacterized membrane protein YphA (DoxX/SURF4 family)